MRQGLISATLCTVHLTVTKPFRCKALFLEKLAHQPQRRPAVAPALDQHVEHLAFVIDGTPEIHPLAGDPHHHLVQMSAVACRACSLSLGAAVFKRSDKA